MAGIWTPYKTRHKSPQSRRVLKIQKLELYIRKGKNCDKKQTKH